jgi:hypothetical protein
LERSISRFVGAALLVLLVAALAFPGGAAAAGPPTIPASWTTSVTATSAVLRAEVNPNGLSTHYRFEYLTLAAYEANLAASREAFAGAVSTSSVALGAGEATIPVAAVVSGPSNPLRPGTAYRFRAIAVNEAGTAVGPERALRTQSSSSRGGLADGRAWELVSPVDKGGGAVAAPGALFGGGDIQAAAGGGALTYGSATAFGDPQGAPPVSQYVSRRSAAGWSTENVSSPLESGSYGDHPDGAPFRLFSDDLARALLLKPRRCEPPEPCPRNYTLREAATGVLTPLPAQAAGMRVLGASPDLGRILFEDEGATYEWSAAGLAPVDLLPPSAGAGAVFQASSADGSIVFFTEGGHLRRYDGVSEATVDLTPAGAVAGVLAVSSDGAYVYYQDSSGLQLWHEGSTR